MRLSSGLLAIAFGCVMSLSAAAQETFGSGSTFVYPVMAKWAAAYSKGGPARIVYEPIGSSAGITEIRQALVDFGVTDAPLPSAQLARDGLIQFPLVIGGVVPVVNLPGISPGQPRFTGPLLADIFLGKIRKWNDPAIAAVNPGVTFPDLPITVVHRADGSGTTFNWADFLAKVSSDWKERVGSGTLISWPTGWGATGNRGVAEYVEKIKGAIGYVEYAYVIQRKMTYGLVQNRSGNFVSPSQDSFRAAAAGADWDAKKDFCLLLTDASSADAYPIVATSFVLMRREPRDEARSRAALAFFKWALNEGSEIADALGDVPLPPALVGQIQAYWTAGIRGS